MSLTRAGSAEPGGIAESSATGLSRGPRRPPSATAICWQVRSQTLPQQSCEGAPCRFCGVREESLEGAVPCWLSWQEVWAVAVDRDGLAVAA